MDLGFSMLEHSRDVTVQSLKLDTITMINDQLIGSPDEDSREKISIPPMQKIDCLIFQASYMFPEHNFTYVFVKVSRWLAKWTKDEKYIIKLGTIVLPIIQRQKEELKI